MTTHTAVKPALLSLTLEDPIGAWIVAFKIDLGQALRKAADNASLEEAYDRISGCKEGVGQDYIRSYTEQAVELEGIVPFVEEVEEARAKLDKALEEDPDLRYEDIPEKQHVHEAQCELAIALCEAFPEELAEEIEYFDQHTQAGYDFAREVAESY